MNYPILLKRFTQIDLGDTYYIRTKSNVSIKINNYEYADSIGLISDIEAQYSKSRYFDDVEITKYNFPTKLAISKSKSHKEPFYILTNGNTRETVKSYGYRFGAIEFIFKNEKTNRFLFGNYKSTQYSSIYHIIYSYMYCRCLAYYSWL